jgi:FAD/FMN-containing dehydrogenase
MRRHGLTVDNLLAVEMVTADGDLLRVDAESDPELFWGLCGAGANFGVVTSFEYRVHPVGPIVLGGPIVWPMDDAVDVLGHYRDVVASAPDELTTIVNLRRAPPLPTIPEALHGVPVCQVAVCWCGPIADGEAVAEPLRRFGRPLLDLVAPRPYVEHQAMFDAAVPHGWHYYWKSCELPALDDALVTTIAEHAGRIDSPRSYAILFQLGGAVSRVEAAATAYGPREAAHNLNISAVSLPGDPDAERQRQWARAFFAATDGRQVGVYVNFLGDEGDQRVRAAYGEPTYARLARLKRRLDPDNVFRLNQNIRPAGAGP